MHCSFRSALTLRTHWHCHSSNYKRIIPEDVGPGIERCLKLWLFITVSEERSNTELDDKYLESSLGGTIDY